MVSLQHIYAGQEQFFFSYVLERPCPLPLIPPLLIKVFLSSDFMNLNGPHTFYNPYNDSAMLQCSGFIIHKHSSCLVSPVSDYLWTGSYKISLNHHSLVA